MLNQFYFKRYRVVNNNDFNIKPNYNFCDTLTYLTFNTHFVINDESILHTYFFLLLDEIDKYSLYTVALWKNMFKILAINSFFIFLGLGVGQQVLKETES